MMNRLAVLLCAALLAGCQTTEVRPAPEPDSAAITAPSSDVPAEYAAFSGIWKGSWDGVLDGNIAVTEISPSGDAKVIYAWGDHPDGRFLRGSSDVSGRIDGNKMTLTNPDGKKLATYTMRSDGKLNGRYVLNGLAKGIFVKS